MTIERTRGPTPNGGVVSEICYLDDKGRPTDKGKAVKAVIRELDAKGGLVAETFADISKQN